MTAYPNLPGWEWPGGPHLEVSVYRPRLSDQESLVESLYALLGLGAVLKGVGITQEPEDAAWKNMQPIELSELQPILADPTQQIRQFYTDGYFEGASVVSLGVISEQAARTDRHPIDVFFYANLQAGDENDRARIGDQARRLLLELARSPEVAYGAIMEESEWLESPTDLAQGGKDSRSYFGDFVLTNWVAAEDRELVLAAFEGAYVEQLEFGTYISTYEWLNPRRMKLSDGRQSERSDLVRHVLVKNFA